MNAQDPAKYPENKFKEAFLAAINEYNQFGVAATSLRFKVDSQSQDQLFGFQVA